MRKLMFLTILLPILIGTIGMNFSNQASAKQKNQIAAVDCEVAARTGRPKIRGKPASNSSRVKLPTLELIVPNPAPSAARRKGPKIKVKDATGKLKKPVSGYGDCG